MSLNSLDVQNKTFNRRFRGYDLQEVDEFLELIVRDYDEFAQRIKDLERDNKSKDERLVDFDNMRDSLNNSLIVAQDAAGNVKKKAQIEGDQIIAEANKRAAQILEAAQREAGRVLSSSYDEALNLVHESDELRRNVRGYHQRLTLLIEGQLANLKSPEWEETVKPNRTDIGDSEEKLREIIEHTSKVFVPNNQFIEAAPSEAIESTVEPVAAAAAPNFPPIGESQPDEAAIAATLSEQMAQQAVGGETLESFAQGLTPRPEGVETTSSVDLTGTVQFPENHAD